MVIFKESKPNYDGNAVYDQIKSMYRTVEQLSLNQNSHPDFRCILIQLTLTWSKRE